MENTNQNQQKPIFEGTLPQGEYEAVLVKATPAEARGSIPPSIRIMFLLDFPQYVSFVSGFMNQTFKSGDKTSIWLRNLGITPTDNRTPVEQLKGKKCKIYIQPSKVVFSNKSGKNIQYYKILALTPSANAVASLSQVPQQFAQPTAQTVVPQVQPVQQPVPSVQPIPVQQPTIQTLTQQPLQQNPFLKPVQTVQPIVAPTVAPIIPQIPVQGVPQPVQQATQTVQPVVQPQVQPVQQINVQQPAVAQPLPSVAQDVVSLDF